MRVPRFVPLEVVAELYRHRLGQRLAAAVLGAFGLLTVLVVSWIQFASLPAALVVTLTAAAAVAALARLGRDHAAEHARRVWLIAADHFGLPDTSTVRREVVRAGRRASVTVPRPIPPSRRVNGRPRVRLSYDVPRWRMRRSITDVSRIQLNYAGSTWAEHDRAAVARLRDACESRLGLTFKVVHTAAHKRADMIELHRAAPIPEHVTIHELPHIPGRLVVGFTGPDAEGPDVYRVVYDDGRPDAYVVAVDPLRTPHFRVHGRTGRGKSVTLDDLIAAFLDYAASGGDTEGHVIAADCKGVGTFVKWKNNQCVTVPRSMADCERAVADAQQLMTVRAAKLNDVADAIIDAYDAGDDPPPRPTFQPVLLILDELFSLMRFLADRDAQTGTATLPRFRGSFADLAQKGRAVDIHVGLSSQWANIKGAGGAEFDAETRGQMDLIVHMGPTTPEQGRVVFGAVHGAEFGPRIPTTPTGRAGVAVGEHYYLVQMPYTYDPVAEGVATPDVDTDTTVAAFAARTARPSTPPATRPATDPDTFVTVETQGPS